MSFYRISRQTDPTLLLLGGARSGSKSLKHEVKVSMSSSAWSVGWFGRSTTDDYTTGRRSCQSHWQDLGAHELPSAYPPLGRASSQNVVIFLFFIFLLLFFFPGFLSSLVFGLLFSFFVFFAMRLYVLVLLFSTFSQLKTCFARIKKYCKRLKNRGVL
jgi:hypothetical protein